MAGETFVKRYPGGYVDGSTYVDATAMNAQEAALLRLLGEDPAADELGVWVPASNRFVFQKITNAQIDPAAAIDKSKLAPLAITDSDISAGAAIAKSKVNLAASIVNADIGNAAAIALSKLGITGSADATKLLRGDAVWSASLFSYGTTLPGSPTDGQIAILVDASPTPTIIQMFRFNSGSASAFKWEFIGGTPFYADVATQESTASASYVDLATVGPTITLAHAGDYEITFSFEAFNSAANNSQAAALKKGAAATSDNESALTTSSAVTAPSGSSRQIIVTGVAASDVYKLQYKALAGTASFQKRSLRIRPIRIS